ncbi:MAG: hypothetical protein IPM82_09440 [Saprospiraceae bacterium]|nr:hypothetical protein [Saprospiraceae bacterium]
MGAGEKLKNAAQEEMAHASEKINELKGSFSEPKPEPKADEPAPAAPAPDKTDA